MKSRKLLIILLFTPFFLWKPTPITFGQQIRSHKDLIDFIDRKIDRSFDTLFSNLDTLSQLSKHQPKVLVKKVYVRVYKTVPVYVPQIDTVFYQKEFPKDTLTNEYLISPGLGDPPVLNQKKKTFLQRIFTHR